MTQPVTTQQSFAKVDDDGTANAGTLGTTNANWTQTVDQPIRIRFLLNTTAKDEVDGYSLYQNYNGGGYAQVTTASTEVKAVASEHSTPPTDGDATTERLSGPDTFVAGQWVDDGIVDSMTIADGSETELEFCVELIGADLVDANTILFEVHFDSGSALDGYTNRPTVTIDKPGPTVVVNALTLAGSAPNINVDAPATIIVNALTLAGSAPNINVDAPATIIVNALTLAGSAVTINVDAPATVVVNALTLAGSAPNITVVPGAISVVVNALTLAGSAPNITVSAIAGFATPIPDHAQRFRERAHARLRR